MGPCLKSYLSYKFDRSETVRDRAKMNLAGHRVRRLFGNYFEPCTENSSDEQWSSVLLNIKQTYSESKFNVIDCTYKQVYKPWCETL